MRDIKLKLIIIWNLLINDYTSHDNHKCWWLWSKKTDVIICFGRKNFHMFRENSDKKEEKC